MAPYISICLPVAELWRLLSFDFSLSLFSHFLRARCRHAKGARKFVGLAKVAMTAGDSNHRALRIDARADHYAYVDRLHASETPTPEQIRGKALHRFDQVGPQAKGSAVFPLGARKIARLLEQDRQIEMGLQEIPAGGNRGLQHRDGVGKPAFTAKAVGMFDRAFGNRHG